jgi:DNA polymerase
MSPETYELCLNLLTTKTARVFDIIEVEDQRFQVNNILSHNCGYQMGKKKFKQTCEMNKLDLPESLIERAHQAFRQKYPQVPQVWYNYEQAAIYAVQNKGKRVTVNKVVWYVEEDFLFAKLPSGRRLAYYGPELKNEKTFWNEDKVSLYHWGVDSLTKKWVSSATYGGKLTENIVQAISRDCMAASMLTLEEKGYQNLITVHDENLCEATNGNLKEFVDLMSARPEWGPDIPLAVKGWEDLRYRK